MKKAAKKAMPKMKTGGMNNPNKNIPTKAIPSAKTGGSTKFSKVPTILANRGMAKKGGAMKGKKSC